MRLRRVLLALVACVAACSDTVALQFSMSAMACCVKAHNECAGLSTPDDCCKGMGHGVAASVSTTPERAGDHAVVALPIVALLQAAIVVSGVSLSGSHSFKRPH